jgi:hypothetical protein
LRQTPVSEYPDAPKDQQNRGYRDNLVDKVFRHPGARLSVVGGGHRLRCDIGSGLHQEGCLSLLIRFLPDSVSKDVIVSARCALRSKFVLVLVRLDAGPSARMLKK